MPGSATLTPTQLPIDGSGIADLSAAIATAASGGGDAFHHTGRELLLVKNGDSGSHTVTIVSQANNFGSQNTDDDLVRTVGAGKIAIIGPLSSKKFRDADGLVQVTYDGVTSVAVKLYAPSVEA